MKSTKCIVHCQKDVTFFLYQEYTVPPIKRLSPSIYLDASHRVPRIPRVARPVNLSRTSRLCRIWIKNPTEAQIMNSCAIHLSGFSETYNGTVPPITVPESMRPLLPTSSLASVLNSSFSWIPHHFQNEKSHNFS
ncbi:3-isopropylmalate dehydrogenase [Dirofilaria immitis]